MLPTVALIVACTAPKPGADAEERHSGDTAPPVGDGAFVAAEIDTATYANQGYERITYTLSPDAPEPYPSLLDGYEPTFYLIQPVDPPDPVPGALMWFHGGSLGDDSAGVLPQNCSDTRVTRLEEDTLTTAYMPFLLAMQDQMAIVLPRNDWCDFWTGTGPDDPIDPIRHYGYYHTQRVLQWLLDGNAGFSLTPTLYAWGTSVGGAAAVHVAHKLGGFQGVVVDASPTSMFGYYHEDPAALEHIFGGAPYDDDGAPSEVWDRYAAASTETLVTDLGLRLPLYIAWNDEDKQVPNVHPHTAVEALEAVYDPEGARWGNHNFAHLAPTGSFHTQTRWPQIPWGYTGAALWEFLTEDKTLLWQEAEEGCPNDGGDECTLGGLVTGASDSDHASLFSQGTIRQVSAEAGSGLLWRDRVAPALPVGVPITAHVIVEVEELTDEDDDAIVGRLVWSEGDRRAELLFRGSDFVPDEGSKPSDDLHQIETTTVVFTSEEAGAGELRWYVYGHGRTNLDAVLYAY